MKKLLSILLIIVLAFSFASCGKKEEPAANVPNPKVEYASLAEINEKVGANMVAVAGATDEAYYIILDDLAEYAFKLDGVSYTLRAMAEADDISGIYTSDGATAFEYCDLTYKLTVVNADSYMVGRWFDGDMQYVLAKDCSAGELNQEEFSNLCAALVAETCPAIGNVFNNLTGSYSDVISQRAMMEVQSMGNWAMVNVTWSSSAFETELWNLTLEMDGNYLVYSDGTHTRVTFNEKDEATYEVVAENLEGYFTLTDGGLVWSGASEVEVLDTVFQAY